MKDNHWATLQKLAERDDGLPIRTTHAGTFEKLYWWYYYVSITTAALVGRPGKWPHRLTYVDLFAGPGVLISKDGQHRMPGSPMIAAHAVKPFDRMIFCEKNPHLATACEQRLAAWGAAERSVVIAGDCNQVIAQVASAIPEDSLTLAFIDPTGLHVHFETLETLTQDRGVDLLILFADRMDIVRNVERYATGESNKLDQMLGYDSRWRDAWQQLENRSVENICRLFNRIYQQELARRLDYHEFESEVVRLPARRGLYTILFASRHPLGRAFWKKSTEKTRSGPRLF